MLKNYHTHTFLCGHAEGEIRDYVETAIKAGTKVLGFSDHVPMTDFPRKGLLRHKSDFRIPLKKLPFYIESLIQLREEYSSDIKILIGFEAEYYPEMFDKMLKLLSPYPYDYLIQGQHFIGNEYDDKVRCVALSDDPIRLKKYVDQTVEGMKTGVFSYLAHPDVYNFTGADDVFRAEMSRICETSSELNIPLEYNLLGHRDRRHYPSERFFRVAAEYNCPIILGCDAHEPEALANIAQEEEAIAVLKKCGVTNFTDEIRFPRKEKRL